MRTEIFYSDGRREVIDDGLPPPAPVDPGLGALTVTEFLQAMVAEGAITQTRANNILNRLKR